jgi:DNA-binding beta-propeller fold protein YncE
MMARPPLLPIRSDGSLSSQAHRPSSGLPTFTTQIASLADPGSITVDPSGKFVYVTGEQSNSVRAYSIIDAAGTLKSMLAPSATAPASMAITATTQ